MKKTLASLALTLGLTTFAFATPLDLTGFQRVGDVSSGTGGIFYAFGFLTDDSLNSLDFDTGPTGGDFSGISDNLLSYEFNSTPGLDPVRTVTLDAFGSPIGFDIVGLGFGGDTIEFLLDRGAFSLGSDPYPGSAGAVFSLTSQDFSSASGTTLDTATTLEQFFNDNSNSSGEYAADVTFSIQALDEVSAVPAPATFALFVIGFIGLGIARGRIRT